MRLFFSFGVVCAGRSQGCGLTAVRCRSDPSILKKGPPLGSCANGRTPLCMPSAYGSPHLTARCCPAQTSLRRHVQIGLAALRRPVTLGKERIALHGLGQPPELDRADLGARISLILLEFLVRSPGLLKTRPPTSCPSPGLPSNSA